MAEIKEIHTLARIQIMVEVDCGTYGPEYTMQYILDHAKQEGLQILATLCKDRRVLRIVGTPSVRTISTIEGSTP